MMSLKPIAAATLLALGLTPLNLSLRAADSVPQKGVITRTTDRLGFVAPILVCIHGYSAAGKQVLEHDLLFMGFKNVPEAEAQFLVQGSDSGGKVEARVLDRINGQQIVGKAYTGSNQRLLIHAIADEIATALTGLPGIARTKIAFRVDTTSRQTEVYIADYDGYNARAVTQDQSLTTAPCWAGRDMLFYCSYKLGNPKIYFHQLSTGQRGSVTPYPGSNISPAVSPDGKKVAMILSKGGSPDLYVADINGGNLRRLTTTRESESSPCWSPDSQTLLFSSRANGPSKLFKIPASGGSMQAVLTRNCPNATEPDWSPDGKWIAFTTLFRDFQICLVPSGGGSAETLAEGEDPSWAPNSRALIFCRGRDKAKRLSLLDVPTKEIKDIARISMSNSQPQWAD